MAARQHLTLTKSRTRDPYAPDFGVWTLATAGKRRGAVRFQSRSLDDVEHFLKGEVR